MTAKKTQTLALILILVPLPLLILNTAAFGITGAIAGGQVATSVSAILMILQSLIGVVALVGIFIGIPVGIYLLVRASKMMSDEKQGGGSGEKTTEKTETASESKKETASTEGTKE